MWVGTVIAMPAETSTTPVPPTAEDEVARICQDLVRFDTSNYGDGSGPGERAAAEHVMGLLTEVGLEPELFESAPGRANVVVRLEGEDSSRPALVLHGHLDVVPARAADWTVDPFEAVEADGLVWGRGAVDMKDMDAMILAAVRQMVREGRRPARDVVVAMFADEEAGGAYGASWAVDHRPELFAGATEAISEVGGFSVDVDGPRGHVSLVRVPRFVDPADAVASGSLLAPMPGAVIRVEVEEGQEVEAGQTVLVLEAMKMQHTVTAPRAGTVTQIDVQPGAQVAAGEVLAVVEGLDTPGSAGHSTTEGER